MPAEFEATAEDAAYATLTFKTVRWVSILKITLVVVRVCGHDRFTVLVVR